MIKSLTALRGLFILFIFLHHAGVYPGGGTMGVVFFFVLSGFSMTLGYHERVMSPDFYYREYLTRRAIKIYPLHWITLIANIPLTLMSALHWWLIPLFFVNAILLQTTVPIPEVYFSYNAVSWFLADILVFSVVFPFIFRWIFALTNIKRGILMLIGFLLYSVIAFISFKLPEGVTQGIIYINPLVRLFDFVFGILLGLDLLAIKEKLAIKQLTRSIEGGIVVAILVIIALLVVESFLLNERMTLLAPLYWPLTAVLILMAAFPARIKILENIFLLRLGECSFTFFLVHRLVIRYTDRLIPIESKLIYVSFCLVVTLILSFLVEHYILTPITQWLTKKNQPFMTARSSNSQRIISRKEI